MENPIHATIDVNYNGIWCNELFASCPYDVDDATKRKLIFAKITGWLCATLDCCERNTKQKFIPMRVNFVFDNMVDIEYIDSVEKLREVINEYGLMMADKSNWFFKRKRLG